MQHVFIVRPFGTKKEINFDQMERDLIRPVLDTLGWQGDTTGEIFEAGNIRAGMMDLLLTADLVIADISIHNANVFYELGVRHSLRHRPTVLIRCKGDEVPFDLKTDRYLQYDLSTEQVAEESRQSLLRTLRDTIRSDTTDSPVYNLLPNLEIRDATAFIAVPQEFSEAVDLAKKNEDPARLGLLATEASRERWRAPGLRVVGRAQFGIGAHGQARQTWEQIRSELPDDIEANLLLSTSYERLGNLQRSQLALDRVLQVNDLPRDQRAESLALRGRNLKTQWREGWQAEPDLVSRQRAAISSGLIMPAKEAYREGFLADVNHYFSGLNAFSLDVIVCELARAHPDLWEARFEEPDKAEIGLKRLERERDELCDAVKVSLEAADKRRSRPGAKADKWLDLSVADHRLLAGKSAAHVSQKYRDAVQQIDDQFTARSAARQLKLLLHLGVLQEPVKASLKALGFPHGPPEDEPKPRSRVVLSTGHRVDAPGRAEPRFPADSEARARDAISQAVQYEQEAAEGEVIAISGLASGNDILFHEVCQELGITSRGGLALPDDVFVQRSVQDSGPDWVERYRKVRDQIKPEVMTESGDPPPWVKDADEHYVFQRCNMWLMEQAYSIKDADVTLIALWNGKGGDGPGGTADMVELAEKRGAKVVILKTQEIFGL